LGVAVERYRLVTRSDFDGLVCAVLLQHRVVEELVGHLNVTHVATV
jgi:hypothetical protein